MTTQSLNLHFKYFSTQNVLICGATKLRRVEDTNFSLHEDEFGPFIRFFF